MVDPQLKKDIVRNLHLAIDSELLDRNDEAYQFYVESLSMVADALRQDGTVGNLSSKDKWNLVKFAQESIARVSILLNKKGEPPPHEARDEQRASAPTESVTDECDLRERLFNSNGAADKAQEMLMCRYRRRLSIATSALEKQNLELELARQLVENEAINRNKLMQSSAWAMQAAHSKFQIEEKLRSGCLKESDFQKQHLYALSLQFNQGNGWLLQLGHDLALYPNNERIARELLDNVLTDNSHPVKATLNNMQRKVDSLISAVIAKPEVDGQIVSSKIESISKVVKQDLNVIQDVLKALFEPLATEKNASITSEVVHHVYFSQLKSNFIALFRLALADVESKLSWRLQRNAEEFCFLPDHVLQEAKTKLHYLTTLHNPYGMLDCTVHVVKLLASSKFDQDNPTSMGADDLLPRLCQVLVSSGLPELCLEAAFMETFMPAEKALGEEGYALTTLQSAVAHLTSESEPLTTSHSL
ncbi:Hypothetical protein NTJ_04752 [Nesidiocoris tenuis]|uniref:VPS9 domain-containing protein n=1 Tax=Nesidiocoris tenuis TaxID=355587 RepID=A0ABN7AI85_9HEMI|nr:Hypothetical protein NTJ_04752 [Nesidiocoris tenuis]